MTAEPEGKIYSQYAQSNTGYQGSDGAFVLITAKTLLI